MFFNLKEAAEHGVNIGTNWSSYSIGSINFNVPESPGGEGENDEVEKQYGILLALIFGLYVL